MIKRFVVFRCPICGKFTYAPLGQKTRLCSFCGKIIRIDARQAIAVDDARQASFLVKRYNLKDGEKNYLEALKAQKKELLNLVAEVEEKSQSPYEESEVVSSSKTRKMLVMLKENCANPINIDKLRGLCRKYNLEWGWVKEQLELLSKEGTVIFPKPWLLQYIGDRGVEGYVPKKRALQKKNSLHPVKNVRKALANVLKDKNEPVSYDELAKVLEAKGFTLEEIEETVRKLSMEGLLVEPKPGFYLWVGDY